MRTVHVVVILFVLKALSQLHAQTPPPFKLSRVPLPAPTGGYAVGHNASLIVDRTRVDSLNPRADQPRRLPVHFWYPAAPTTAPYRRYVSDVREQDLITGVEFLSGALAYIATNARNEAPVLPGKFPVVLFSPGYGLASEEYQTLIEQVASSGYIVVAVNSPGISGNELIDGDLYLTKDDIGDVLADNVAVNDIVVADLKAVLAQLKAGRGLPSLALGAAMDFTRIGAFGHSFGGSAAVRLAGEGGEVKAGVDIDGTVFALDLTAPRRANLMFIQSGEGMAGNDTSMATVYANLVGRGFFVRQKETVHGTFSDLYFLARATGGVLSDYGIGLNDFGTRPDLNLPLTRQLLVLYFDLELKKQSVAKITAFLTANKTRFSYQSR